MQLNAHLLFLNHIKHECIPITPDFRVLADPKPSRAFLLQYLNKMLHVLKSWSWKWFQVRGQIVCMFVSFHRSNTPRSRIKFAKLLHSHTEEYNQPETASDSCWLRWWWECMLGQWPQTRSHKIEYEAFNRYKTTFCTTEGKTFLSLEISTEVTRKCPWIPARMMFLWKTFR